MAQSAPAPARATSQPEERRDEPTHRGRVLLEGSGREYNRAPGPVRRPPGGDGQSCWTMTSLAVTLQAPVAPKPWAVPFTCTRHPVFRSAKT